MRWSWCEKYLNLITSNCPIKGRRKLVQMNRPSLSTVVEVMVVLFFDSYCIIVTVTPHCEDLELSITTYPVIVCKNRRMILTISRVINVLTGPFNLTRNLDPQSEKLKSGRLAQVHWIGNATISLNTSSDTVKPMKAVSTASTVFDLSSYPFLHLLIEYWQ